MSNTRMRPWYKLLYIFIYLFIYLFIICLFVSILLPRNNQVLLTVVELEVCFRPILIPQMIRGFNERLSYQGFGGFLTGEQSLSKDPLNNPKATNMATHVVNAIDAESARIICHMKLLYHLAINDRAINRYEDMCQIIRHLRALDMHDNYEYGAYTSKQSAYDYLWAISQHLEMLIFRS
jgi:hypothetical protein